MKKWLLVVVNSSTGESKTLSDAIYAETQDKALDKFMSRLDTISHGKYASNDWNKSVIEAA